MEKNESLKKMTFFRNKTIYKNHKKNYLKIVFFKFKFKNLHLI